MAKFPIFLSLIATFFVYDQTFSEPLKLNETMNGVDLYHNATSWIAPPSLNLNDPCGQDHQCSSKIPGQIELRNGFGGLIRENESLYLRFAVLNPSQEEKTFIITSEWASAEDFYLFQISEQQRVMRKSSLETPLAFRDVKTRFLNIAVNFPPGETIIVIRSDALNFHKGIFRIWDTESLNSYLAKERMLMWLLYGISMALIVSYLGVAFSAKDMIWFWPAQSLLSYVLFDIHYRSYQLELLYSLNINFTYVPHPPGIISSLLGLAGFCKSMVIYDRLLNPNSRNFKILQIIFIMIISTIPFVFTTPLRVSIFFIFIANILLIPFACYYFYYSTIHNALHFYFGLFITTPLVIGHFLFSGALFGFLETNLWNDTSLLIGYIILALVLGVIVGTKTMNLNMEKELAIVGREKMQASLEVAKIVQESLLPKLKLDDYDTYFFYRPAEIVGGDSFYFDRFDDYVFISIFDVTGHGVSSAIMTGTLAGALPNAFKYEINQSHSVEIRLGQIVKNLNRIILNFNQGTSGLLVTMACGLIDKKSSKFYFLNSGHIPSYLIKSDRIVTLFSHGSPLGLRDDPIFQIQTFSLNAGDKILFITDGITENIDRAGKSIRERRLLKELNNFRQLNTIPFGKMFEQLMQNHFAHMNLDDDMTFLIIGSSEPDEINLAS